jgi:hypothetical protein
VSNYFEEGYKSQSPPELGGVAARSADGAVCSKSRAAADYRHPREARSFYLARAHTQSRQEVAVSWLVNAAAAMR